jgi:DNA primase large subunit
MIRDHFKAVVGDLIAEVRLIRGPTGQVKGFAYVHLSELSTIAKNQFKNRLSKELSKAYNFLP